MAGNSLLPAPRPHPPVASERPVRTGFLVRVHGRQAKAAMQARKYLDHLAALDPQALPQPAQRVIERASASARNAWWRAEVSGWRQYSGSTT